MLLVQFPVRQGWCVWVGCAFNSFHTHSSDPPPTQTQSCSFPLPSQLAPHCPQSKLLLLLQAGSAQRCSHRRLELLRSNLHIYILLNVYLGIEKAWQRGRPASRSWSGPQQTWVRFRPEVEVCAGAAGPPRARPGSEAPAESASGSWSLGIGSGMQEVEAVITCGPALPGLSLADGSTQTWAAANGCSALWKRVQGLGQLPGCTAVCWRF